MELNNLEDNIVVIEDFISFEECIQWLQRVPAPFLLDNEFLEWKYRNINIIDNPIVKKVENYWNSIFNTSSLKIYEAQVQLWPIKSYSTLHIHNENLRETGTYNSMLYLNNNFFGGEFYTKKDIISPKPGMLTFFNGCKTHHGVKPIYWNNRYTLVFWFE